jgi:formylglycine-generating enzyme required for sulfatase activity
MTEQRYAILIASSQFPLEDKLDDLRCPVNDVDGLNEILISKERGAFTDTILLKNRPHYEIVQEMGRVLKKADKNDLVLIYFSGHGKLNEIGKLHLATVDTVVKELETTSIPVERIRTLIDISNTNKIVIILDCCFSGAAGPDFTRSGGYDLPELSNARGTYIITSSSEFQTSMEKETDQYGVFTKHVIAGLSTGDADYDNNGFISIDELYRYADHHVRSEGHQKPMKWDLEVQGELIISKSGKTPRTERNRKIREKLSEYLGKSVLPDEIWDKAKRVMALEPQRITGKMAEYDVLLENFGLGDIEFGNFISAWYKIAPAPKHEPPITPPPQKKHEKSQASHAEIEEPKKTPRKFKKGLIAVLGIFLILAIVGIWFTLIKPSLEESKKEALRKQVKVETDEITDQLKQLSAQIPQTEDLKSIRDQEKEISRKLKNLTKLADSVGMASTLQDVEARLQELGHQLNDREYQLAEREKLTLTEKRKKEALRKQVKGASAKLTNQLQQLSVRIPQAEDLKVIRGQEDEIRQKLKKLTKLSDSVGMASTLRDVDARLQKLGRQLDDREAELAMQKETGQLFVETVPSGAHIRILNITPKFKPGLELEAGPYHIEVSAENYAMQKRWIELEAEKDNRIQFELVKLASSDEKKVLPKPFTNSLDMTFVHIPSGTFTMGSPKSESDRDDDETQHQVTLTKGFYMQTTEVTQAQWQAVMGNNPSRFKDCADCPDCPVENVFWNDVQKFINKLNQRPDNDKIYRLPTEAEWEYACRAGTDTPFFFGKCLSTDQANYDGNYPLSGCKKGKYRQKTTPVASFKPNSWGLYDMHGNVWEWCQDWYGTYPSGNVTDPAGSEDGVRRILRGGGWYYDARGCRSAYRGRVTPGARDANFGFRLVLPSGQ